MRDALERVRGAVSTKDLVPVLKHFAFRKGNVEGFDGRVHIVAPLPKEYRKLAFTVDAAQFLAAVDACEGEPLLEYDGTTHALTVARKPFSATLSTTDSEAFPAVLPDAPRVSTGASALAPILRGLRAFCGEDASRPWACGVLVDGAAAYATNNVVLARAKLPGVLSKQPFNMPVFGVDELLRIGEEPRAVGVGSNSVTFHYADKSFLRSSLFAVEWPKHPDSMLRHTGKWVKAAPGLLEAVRVLMPFCADQKFPIIVLDKDTVRTQEHVHSAKVTGFAGLHGSFHAKALLSVLEVATHIDWASFPRVHWKSDDLQGVIVGVHV